MPKKYEYDVFISHATEDKSKVVRPLAKALRNLGLRVWFDEYTLQIGDSLIESIDRGLLKSKYGVLVLSKNFFRKPWPKYERVALATMELRKRKRILPVWYGVTREEVMKFSPNLADRLATLATGKNTDEVALAILSAVNPRYSQSLNQLIAFRDLKGSMQRFNLERIRIPPPRHAKVHESLLIRMRNIQLIFREVYPQTLREFIDGFLVDVDPRRELQLWEKMASVFLEMQQRHKLTPAGVNLVYKIILAFVSSADKSTWNNLQKEAGVELIIEVLELWRDLLKDIPYVEESTTFSSIAHEPHIESIPMAIRSVFSGKRSEP